MKHSKPTDLKELKQAITRIVVEILDVDVTRLTLDANFIQDLGADYLDLIELAMKFEKEFDIHIQDQDMSEIQSFGQTITYLCDKLNICNGTNC